MRFLLFVVLAVLFAAPARAQIPDYDFQWSVVGSPGNAPYTGPSAGNLATNRGSVSSVFRIAALEVSTAQWLEFANAVGPLGETFRIGDGPIGGYEPDPTYSGPGSRYRLKGIADAGRLPVYGISWLNAARYCNWLHNNKDISLAALTTGAYDTTTFGVNASTGGRTDALARLPGARFWIPTLDEWMKAAHYDPEKNGPNAPGWWTFPNMSDSAPIAGLPGASGAQTNAGLTGAPADALLLGSYPGERSPWGLLDASGGASEWLEDADDPADRLFRLYDGASAFDPFLNPTLLDALGGVGSSPAAGESSYVGLRVASGIPDVSVCGCVFCGLFTLFRRRRPWPCDDSDSCARPRSRSGRSPPATPSPA